MFECGSPDGGPSLKAWYSEGIGKVRITSTPGGISMDADAARDLRDELDELIEAAEESGA